MKNPPFVSPRRTSALRQLRSVVTASSLLALALPIFAADPDGDGVHDPLDIRPATPAGALFGQAVPAIYPEASYLTCLLGIFDEPAVHNWKIRLRSTATENVSLVLTATTINTAEAGSLRATVTDETGLRVLSLIYPATNTANVGTLNLRLQGGKTYNLRLELVGAPPAPQARHYEIGALDRRLEMAWTDPLRYLEHEHQAWAVLADANEKVGIDFFTDSPPMGANQSTHLTAKVTLADGTVVVPTTNLTLPATLTVPASPAARGLVVVIEHTDGHFRMRRQNNGGDIGFYALPCPPSNRPPIARARDVTVVTGPNATECSAPASINDGSFDPDGDPIVITQSPAGPFPVGNTQVTLTVTDQHGASSFAAATVTVIDNTPPVLVVPPAMIVGNDPGTCDAVVSFKPKASDTCGPVTVICTPPSGSTFPKGTTTVQVVATDAAGNRSTGSFTVTVQDREAPHADCVPTTNPSGNKVPTAGENPKSGQNPDGFYQLSGADNCDGARIAIYIKDSASDFVAGPFAPGDKVKITQAPGVTPNQKKMAGVVVAHIQLKGDALVYGVDASGNRGEPHLCLVPPFPK